LRYFEDFVVGSKEALKGRHQFSEEEIVEFATRWDPQPFHIDREAAADSIFGGIVACSSHIIAASISIPMKDEGDATAAVSALGFREMKLFAPVRPGDTISTFEEVLETRLSKSRPGCGIVVFRDSISNQKDELVMRFETAALIKCRESA
jgi:acyl dehydratase